MFCLLVQNVISKNFWIPKKLYEIRKKCFRKILHLKKLYKFTSDYFLTTHVLFVLIVENVMKDEKFHFGPNICVIRKIC